MKFHEFIKPYRGIGKTKAMLEEAIKAANARLYVVIVALDEKHKGQLNNMLRDLGWVQHDPYLCVMLIKDVHISHKPFIVSIRGGKKPDKILFDHYTMETEFKNLLEETFRYYSSEPLYWKRDGFENICPVCGYKSIPFSFCPHCGQKLLTRFLQGDSNVEII